MHYLDFLAGLHRRLAPRTYFEIGINTGHSLALSRCPSIGVDPAFNVGVEIVAPARLYRRTSDDYFAALTARDLRPFARFPIDLAYVDGLHLFEYALRDFIGLERYAAPTSVIAVDDVLPRDAEEAARDRTEWPWTGDVFRIIDVLRAYRPDLDLVLADTDPTGTLLVTGLDPSSTVLSQALEEIVRITVVPDPQEVPAEVIGRVGALSAADVLALPLWDELREARVDQGPMGVSRPGQA